MKSTASMFKGLVAVGLGLSAIAALASAAVAKTPAPHVSEATKARIQATLLRAPLSFEANQGQTDERVKFIARGSGYTMFLTANEAVMVLKKATGMRQQAIEKARSHLSPQHSELQTVVRMKLVGANPDPKVAGLEALPGKVNYFIGNDPKKWRKNIPTYKRLEYRDVYPGVNLVYYGN